ncbi:unnamed protein product [Aureobasidium uvarum]|uniref:Ubiquitin-like protease family profile domain-containing protein n=1 Tax=Aureobasidium uvarum TaxID=2773716 RepID=A0A9N8KGZ2_9PEZI|nr:unnamed protein product [Aureobasidium uvarum]
MAIAPDGCPDCRPGEPNGRCPKHKKYNPGRSRRKKDVKERLAHLFKTEQPQNDIMNQSNTMSQSNIMRKKQKETKTVEETIEAITESVDPSTVKRFTSLDVEAFLTPTIKAIVGSLTNPSTTATSSSTPSATEPPVSSESRAAAAPPGVQPGAPDLSATGAPVSSVEQLDEAAVSAAAQQAETSNTLPPETGASSPDGSSSSFDDSDDESDSSDESDYAYSDFGDESDDSYEEDTDAEDDVEEDDAEMVAVGSADQNKQTIINLDLEPTLASKKKQELFEKEQEEVLAQKLINLYKNVAHNNPLGVFAESCLDVEEKFREEAEHLQISVAKVSMLRDVLVHEMYLYEYIALQPSSPLMKGLPSWLNDNTIHNMVDLGTRDSSVEGSEFLDPTVVGFVLPLSTPTAQTLIQLNNYVDNKVTAPFNLKESTTRVVAVLAFPGHWTMFGIDSSTETITFVDSLPAHVRRQYARENVVCPTPAKQANLDDCGVFSAHNAIMYMNGQEFKQAHEPAEAREFAIRTRWMFQERIRGLALGTEGPNDRFEGSFSERVIAPDVTVIEHAQARTDALSNLVRKETPDEIKRRLPRRKKLPKAGKQYAGQMANDRRLSKRQKRIVSPASFLPSCVSGIRDLIYILLSTPGNMTGMTVEDMEGPIRGMMERQKFAVPEAWNLVQLLRVILDRQTHHFEQLKDESGKWIATRIPARQLTGRYLNVLRSKKCSPTPSPLEHPAMLHIYLSRFSGVVSTIQLAKLERSFDARIKTTNALFGAQKQQPETNLYTQGTLQYPMHIKCALPNVQGTDLLRDMLETNQDCIVALQELSDHAQKTSQDDPTFHGQFTYRIIVSGLDGGSVNNDSWQDMKETYPRLRGQLLICDDRGIPAPDDPVVVQKPMLDWATPACLLSKAERKKGKHKHVVWGMFDMAMLAQEWTRRSWASISRVPGPSHAKIEHDQQLLACRKLLLSNSLMFYYRIDRSIAMTRVTAQFTDPAFVDAQTTNGNVSWGRNEFVVDRCVPEQEPFARVCRWGSSHQPLDTWALSDRPPQDDEPLLGFYCDQPACYVLEIEECRHAAAMLSVTLNKTSLDLHAESRTQKSKGSSSASSGSAQDTDPKYLFLCSLWPTSSLNENHALLDPFMHTPDGQLVKRSEADLQQLYESGSSLGTFHNFRKSYDNHVRYHEDQDLGRTRRKKKKSSTRRPVAYVSNCTLWHHSVPQPQRQILDPIIHDTEGNFVENPKDVFKKLTKTHPEVFKDRSNLQKGVERHAEAHKEKGTIKKSEQHTACKLWSLALQKHKIDLLDPLIHDDKGYFVEVSETVFKQLLKDHPQAFWDLSILMKNVETHKKAHETRGTIAAPKQQDRALCKLWSRQPAMERKQILDPLIHDDEGNFVKRPDKLFQELMEEHPGVFERLENMLTLVDTHTKAHEKAGTVATSEQQVDDYCTLWNRAIPEERLELLNPLLHDDEGNFVECSEENLRKLMKENRGVFNHLQGLSAMVNNHKTAHLTKRKKRTSKGSGKASSSTKAKPVLPQAQPDPASASVQTPTKKKLSTNKALKSSPLTGLSEELTLPTPGKTITLPMTPKKNRRHSDRIAALGKSDLKLDKGTEEEDSDVKMNSSADSNEQSSDVKMDSSAESDDDSDSDGPDSDDFHMGAVGAKARGPAKPSTGTKSAPEGANTKQSTPSQQPSGTAVTTAQDTQDTEQTQSQGPCKEWHINISTMRRDLLQPIVHDSSNNFVDRGVKPFKELMANNPRVFNRLDHLLATISAHRKVHEKKGTLSDKPIPAEDHEEEPGSSSCKLWHPSTLQTRIDLLNPRVHDASGNFVDLSDDDLQKLMDTGLFKRYDQMMHLINGHRKAHEQAGTLSSSPQKLEQAEDISSAAEGADEPQEPQPESVQVMEEENWNHSNNEMDLDAPGDDDYDSDPYGGIQ